MSAPSRWLTEKQLHVAAASVQLLDELVTSAPPKDREVEAVKARARAAQRFAV